MQDNGQGINVRQNEKGETARKGGGHRAWRSLLAPPLRSAGLLRINCIVSDSW